MIFAEGGLAVFFIFVWIFCIFDCIAAEPTLVRNLPKTMWLLIVIILPDVGSVAWLILGRPQGVTFTPGSTTARTAMTPPSPSRRSGPLAPDDDPDFIARMEQNRLRQWEAELRKREEDLRRKEQGEN